MPYLDFAFFFSFESAYMLITSPTQGVPKQNNNHYKRGAKQHSWAETPAKLQKRMENKAKNQAENS